MSKQGAPRRWRLWVATAAAVGLTAGPALAATNEDSGPPASLPAAGTCATGNTAWPEYQGDPTHAANACSKIDRTNVTDLRLKWYFGTNGPVSDTPAVDWGTVFAGDFGGTFYAVDQTAGTKDWSFDTTAANSCYVDASNPHQDKHGTSFGQIPGSPLTATINGVNTVFVVAGGSVYALDAKTGHCSWAVDLDPLAPGNSVEAESSPVLDTAVNPPELLLGDDVNGSSGVAVTGMLAFNADNGALLWKYAPERDTTLTPAEFGGSEADTLACGDGVPTTHCSGTNVPAGMSPNDTKYADSCGDVWSSPALDTSFKDSGQNSFQGSDPTPARALADPPKQIASDGDDSRDGLVVFGTADCAAHGTPQTALDHGDYIDNETTFALDPVTGIRAWNVVEPYDGQYMTGPNEPGSGDDDFGSSAIIANMASWSVPSCRQNKGADAGRTNLVIEGSKTGYAYGICEETGQTIWSNQIAQPGQLSPDFVGAVGGMIGSPTLGESNGNPEVFFTSAILTPFANDGVREPGDGDTNISSCPGAVVSQLPLLPACPDLTILNDPQRLVSLHGVNAATGAVDFQIPSVPSFAAASYTNGVVFFPDSLAGGVAAFDSNTGKPLWAYPLASVPASAAAIAGDSIYLGTGETESNPDAPPQLFGIWSFSTSALQPNVTPPPTPAGALPVP